MNLDINQLFYAVFTAGAVWAGIRADILNIHAQIADINRTAQRAHDRIDAHLQRLRSTTEKQSQSDPE